MEIKIFDSSCRDGNHSVKHQITKAQIKEYASRAERAGIPALIVGHGNGLGASSLHLGFARLSDKEMLRTARKELKKSRLGTFVLPGFATLKDIDMAISEGVDVFQIASHCTEATVTKQYIEYAKKKDKEVYGVLMMSHMIKEHELGKQAKIMVDYGANGIFIMDSAGALFPPQVLDKVFLTGLKTQVPIGFHPHNNLGLAIANGIEAVSGGATMIDGTTRGLGAGAGNCPLEVLVPVLHKMGYSTGIDVEKLFDCAEYIASQFPPQEITPISITSGLSGVFSGFKPHVLRASKKFKVSPHAIFKELGKRKTVAGQEDQVERVARELRTHPIEALS